MAYSSKEKFAFFFSAIDGKGHQYICLCGTSRTGNVKRAGYANFVSNIDRMHPDWEARMALGIKRRTRDTHVDKKGTAVFGWLEQLVPDCRPLHFVESDLARKYSSLALICQETWKKYMLSVESAVVSRLQKLPKGAKYGLIFDGWSDGNRHYFATFISHRNENDTPLLNPICFQPLLKESDLSAASHQDLFFTVLSSFELLPEYLLFLTGHNCSVNKALSNSLGVPLVGCASHRFNLAVNRYLRDFEPSLGKVHDVCSKLRTIKDLARLGAKGTALHPRIRNKNSMEQHKLNAFAIL
jgi:hypothetical protein